MEEKKVLGCGLRTALWAMVVIGGIILGFVFLMRSCLSQWDTFGTMGWPGVTEDQKSLVIIKSYSKTNSYSQNNGMTHISQSTTFYLEKIDLTTGKVSKKKKLMNQRKIKNGGLQCYGGYKNRLWVFANNLRAYDMNTLEQVVKLEDIENKNPQLKGKLPVENHYYDAHINMGYITITALDGDKFNIMLDDLHAELIDPDQDSFNEFSSGFQKEKEALKFRMDSLEKSYYSSNISRKYDEMSKKRDEIYAKLDSIQKIEENARELFDANNDLKTALEDFGTWSNSDIGGWVIMKDTTAGYGYILKKDEPSDKYFDLSNFSSLGSESDKVKLYRMQLEINKESRSRYDDYNVIKTETLGTDKYLQGGFMRNYRTAKIQQLKNPDGFIIFSRDIIGNKGKLLVTRIDLNGKKLWQTNALMSFDVTFTTATPSHLIICGVFDQEKQPSYANSDALRIIDLKTGAVTSVKY
jgi:ASC-1-like (ASCH) protein